MGTNLGSSENGVELVDGRESNVKVSVLLLRVEGDDAVVVVVQAVSVIESVLTLVKGAGDELEREERGERREKGERVSFDASSFRTRESTHHSTVLIVSNDSVRESLGS